MFPVLHPALGLPEGTPKTIAQAAGGIPVILGGAAVAAPAVTPFISSLLAAKTLPMGTVAATTVYKTITKGGILPVAIGGAGLLAGMLLSGGSKQEQKQAAAQEPVLTQDQRLQAQQRLGMRDLLAAIKTSMAARIDARTKADVTVPVAVTPTYDVTAGRDVEIGGVTTFPTTITETHTTTGLTQIPTIQTGQFSLQELLAVQQAQQIPVITQMQEAQQEGGGMNWLLIAALGIGAYLFLGRRKRAR